MTKLENAKVYVVDDDPFVRKSLDRLLRSVGLAVETYASAEAFLEKRTHTGPACLVLDVQMPGINGLDLQRKLLLHEDALPVIFITAHGDIPMSVKALKKGAIDFLSKPFDETDLLDAVNEALQKDTAAMKRREEIKGIRRKLDSLTPREYETLTYVIAGALNKQIAFTLKISEATVKAHRGRIMEKMGVDSVAELVRLTEKAAVKPAEKII